MAYNSAFDEFPVLETERLLMRRLELKDAAAMAEYAKDPSLLQHIDGFITSYEEAVRWIDIWNNEAYGAKAFIRWGIENKAENKLIGTIYLFAPVGDDKIGRKMDLGYEISKPYRNMGYAAEAIRRISRYGLEVMELKRIQAQIIPENSASIRACIKAGFVLEGIMRNFCPYVNILEPRLKSMTMLSLIPEDII
jgi:ribosomal-protein-alanine N-acetyltransferase